MTDKHKHFIAGVCICLAFGALFGSPTGLLVAIIAGLAKEAFDSFGYGCVELNDFLATLAGGVVGFLILLLR